MEKNKNFDEIIKKFEAETGYTLTVLNGRLYYCGCIDLEGTEITSLPNDLTVSRSLFLCGTKITSLPNGLTVGGGIDIRRTEITSLPSDLIVGGSLNLSYTEITSLPNGLIVGGNLFLNNTKIASLPNVLKVGGSLDLEGTKITSLPNGLKVGDSLDLEGTEITSLPNGLIVGGNLFLNGTKITSFPNDLAVCGVIYTNKGIRNVKNQLTDEQKKLIYNSQNPIIFWPNGQNTYMMADGIFSVIDNHHGNVYRVHAIGSTEPIYIVTDGENHWAHGYTLQEAKTDLIFKINNRDTSRYKNMSFGDSLSFEEAIAAYRIITGACSLGTRNFIETRLPQPHKESYTIGEIIALTENEYGGQAFKSFFI